MKRLTAAFAAIALALSSACGPTDGEICIELYQQCLIAALINAESFDDEARFEREVQACVQGWQECVGDDAGREVR